MKCSESCNDCVNLALKVIFVAVFTYGVMSAVCCMKTCSQSSSCCKNSTVQTVKQCGPNCQKACCNK